MEVVRDKACPWVFNVGKNVSFHLPVNGKVYTKREAHWIGSPKLKKRSKERGAMIRFMVQEGYVLCKENCLYKLVRRTEMERLPVAVGSDDWGKRGRPTNETASKKMIQYVPIPLYYTYHLGINTLSCRMP